MAARKDQSTTEKGGTLILELRRMMAQKMELHESKVAMKMWEVLSGTTSDLVGKAKVMSVHGEELKMGMGWMGCRRCCGAMVDVG